MKYSRIVWAVWLLRYWVLDKYRRPVFAAACAIAATAATGLSFELWRR